MPQEDLMQFDRIDETGYPGAFISVLDAASGHEGIGAMKRRTYALLDARPGQRILEVGCGTGDDARELARMVSPGGKLVAVDKSEALIAEARKRAAQTGSSIDFLARDATALKLDSGAFDACRVERTLIHIPEAAAAIGEMVRVLRGGGRLVAYEPDLEAYMIDSPDRELTRRLVDFWYAQLRCGRVARQLPALFREHGLTEIRVEPRAMTYDFDLFSGFYHGALQRTVDAGVATGAEVSDWFRDLERARDNGTFFCANMGYIVTGRKR